MTPRQLNPRVDFLLFTGLMHLYALSGGNYPAIVVLMQENRGNNDRKGFALRIPLLDCPDPAKPCVYKPRIGDPLDCACDSGSEASRNAFELSGSMWLHGKVQNQMYADGHVAAEKGLATVTGGTTDFWVDPYTGYDAPGRPESRRVTPRSIGTRKGASRAPAKPPTIKCTGS